MSAQTTYQRDIDARIHGSLNDLNDNELQSNNAEAAIAIGIAVSRGTNEDDVVPAVDAEFIGISIRDLSQEAIIITDVIPYVADDNVSVLRSGRINLTCPTGCTAGDLVLFADGTGVIDSGTAGAGATQIGGATWETTTAAGEVGIVRVPSTVTIA